MGKYHDLADLAEAAARRGAERIRSMRRPAASEWTEKTAPADWVTEVDREAERAIAETLLAGEPDSGVLGEELSPQGSHAGLLWVVDPLDGTANYLHGYPAYAVSIGAVVDGDLAAGVVLDVDRDLLYRATAGGGAWCGERRIGRSAGRRVGGSAGRRVGGSADRRTGGSAERRSGGPAERRLRVSSVTDPALAMIGTGFPFKTLHLLPAYLRQFTTILKESGGVRRAGAASLDLVDVAQGRFDGFWELWLAKWDVAAGSLILREAGGVITDLDGNPEVLREGAFVAGNPAIHAWLLEVLAE